MFCIEKIDYSLGAKKINISDIYPEIISKTGIPYVFEIPDHDNVSHASRLILDTFSSGEIKDIAVLIHVTRTSEYSLPSSAFFIAEKIKAPKNLMAFDINQGCSGFVQALIIAETLANNIGPVLLVCSDSYRSKLDKNDRGTFSVFSDAASATIISNKPSLKINKISNLTDGSKSNWLFHSQNKDINNSYLHMSGGDIWLFTKKYVVNQIIELIKDSNKVDAFYLHQASKLVIAGMKKGLSSASVDPAKILENYQSHGNTVSSTIQFLLKIAA